LIFILNNGDKLTNKEREGAKRMRQPAGLKVNS
jgi:hypothetical protein